MTIFECVLQQDSFNEALTTFLTLVFLRSGNGLPLLITSVEEYVLDIAADEIVKGHCLLSAQELQSHIREENHQMTTTSQMCIDDEQSQIRNENKYPPPRVGVYPHFITLPLLEGWFRGRQQRHAHGRGSHMWQGIFSLISFEMLKRKTTRTCRRMATTPQRQGCSSSPSPNQQALRRLTVREHQLHASGRWPHLQCVWSTRQRPLNWHKRYSLQRQAKGLRTWCRPITGLILVLVLKRGGTDVHQW